jgi:hypothetical protein
MPVTVIKPSSANPKLKNPNDLSPRLDYKGTSFLLVGDMDDDRRRRGWASPGEITSSRSGSRSRRP